MNQTIALASSQTDQHVSLAASCQTAIGPFSWCLLPDFQLRTCGFPAELVHGTDRNALKQATQQERLCGEDVNRRTQDLLAGLDTQITGLEPDEQRRERNRLQKMRRRLNAHQALLPNDEEIVAGFDLTPAMTARGKALENWHRAVSVLNQQIENNLSAEINCLVDTVRSGRFEEALFISNPAFHQRICREGGPLDRLAAKDMRHLLTLSRYVRRFCTRNETVAFFGPTTFARLDPTVESAVALAPPKTTRTEVDCSTWVAQGLMERARKATPALARVARQDPLWRRSAKTLCFGLDGRKVDLNDDAVAVWNALEEPRRLSECADLVSSDQARLKKAVLTIAPALRWAPELPSTDLFTLRSLAETLDDPDVSKLYSIANDLETAVWPAVQDTYREAEKLVSALGLGTSRRGGDHYADRTLFNIECTSAYDGNVLIGAPAIASLQRALEGIMPLCVLDGLLSRADARQALRTRLNGQDRPLLEMLHDDTDVRSTRSAALAAALEDLVRATPVVNNTVRLSAQSLGPLLRRFQDTLHKDDLDNDLCLPGIDVLAAGHDLTQPTWVLGEIHDDSSAIFGGSQSRLRQPYGDLYERFAQQLTNLTDVSGMATVLSRRRHKAVTPEMPGLTIEFTGKSGKDSQCRAPIAEVTISANGRHLLYEGKNYHLWPGDLSGVIHVALALPTVKGIRIRTGDATPRIMVGDMVLQRAQWMANIDAKMDLSAVWKWAQVLQHNLGLPRQVYIRHADEPKPIFVDLENPLHLSDLARLPAGQISISEALPNLDQLWWKPGGKAHSSEFRIGTVMQFGDGFAPV